MYFCIIYSSTQFKKDVRKQFLFREKKKQKEIGKHTLIIFTYNMHWFWKPERYIS